MHKKNSDHETHIIECKFCIFTSNVCRCLEKLYMD